MKLTQLSHIVLGLVIEKPRTGHAVRRAFETTPLGRYSSSPGSIYPALSKLEKAGLLRNEGRGSEYEATALGREALDTWLAEPVTRDAVERDLDVLLLRFSLLGLANDPSLTRSFLTQFESEVSEHLRSLQAFAASAEGEAMPFHNRAALEAGIGTYEVKLSWARKVLGELEKGHGAR